MTTASQDLPRPNDISLKNWREPESNKWAFQHVRELIPTENIPSSRTAVAKLAAASAETALELLPLNQQLTVGAPLTETLTGIHTDALVILQSGKLLCEWSAPHYNPQNPHIVFSISKSITATLAGILIDQGKLNPQDLVSKYLPEVAGSAYADCQIQHVLDMQVALDFDESYLSRDGAFGRYRVSTGWNPANIDDQPTKGLYDFLCSIPKSKAEHGTFFDYSSPNSDLLGWVLSRAAGKNFSQLLSENLWQPMGAEADAYVTVDAFGAPRTAGGICLHPRDLARLGELMRLSGFSNSQQLVSEQWVNDCRFNGSVEAWQRGEFKDELPQGSYRNKWYQRGDAHQSMIAIGIHGQWLYIDPVAEMVIVRLSSQPLPLDPKADVIWLATIDEIIANSQ